MSNLSVTIFSDGPSKQPNNLPSEIPFELIDFIGQKIVDAGYTNVKDVAKAHGTKNPNKLVMALQEFGKTGKLNQNYMRDLSNLLSFKMSEIQEISDRHYDALRKEFTLCAQNLDLILKNTDFIIENVRFRNITFQSMGIQLMYIGRQRPLSLGELVFLWNQNQLIAQDVCCGPVYIIGAGGSPLSGSHQFRGMCSTCKKLVYGSLPSFGQILQPFSQSEYPYEYEPTTCTIEELAQNLSAIL